MAATAIATRAAGNPLFIEQLAEMVRQRPDLRSSSLAQALPDNVRAVIAARIDLLPPEERDVSGPSRRRANARGRVRSRA